MDPAERFLWGFCGSAAVELITFIQVYYAATINMPERYKHKAFWVARILLCLAGGGLCIAYKLDNPIVALNVGAAAPSIFIAFTRGYKDDSPPPVLPPAGPPPPLPAATTSVAPPEVSKPATH